MGQGLSVVTLLHSPNGEVPDPACPQPQSLAFPTGSHPSPPQYPGDWVGQNPGPEEDAQAIWRRVIGAMPNTPLALTPSSPGTHSGAAM